MKNGYDPFDDALAPETGHYGHVHIEAFQGFFVTGQRGATPYDETVHGDRKHYLVIEFTFTPIDSTRQVFTIPTVKWAAEYSGGLMPSAVGLAEEIAKLKGLTMGQFNPLRELSGLLVRTERIPRPDNEEGETWTTHRFLEIYPSEDACREAYEEAGGSVQQAIPFTHDEIKDAAAAAVGATIEAADDPQRATFALFLPALWTRAKDMAIVDGTPRRHMVELLEDNPQLVARFSITSPEVQKVMSAAPVEDIPF